MKLTYKDIVIEDCNLSDIKEIITSLLRINGSNIKINVTSDSEKVEVPKIENKYGYRVEQDNNSINIRILMRDSFVYKVNDSSIYMVDSLGNLKHVELIKDATTFQYYDHYYKRLVVCNTKNRFEYDDLLAIINREPVTDRLHFNNTVNFKRFLTNASQVELRGNMITCNVFGFNFDFEISCNGKNRKIIDHMTRVAYNLTIPTKKLIKEKAGDWINEESE